jgi:hypothetical protein
MLMTTFLAVGREALEMMFLTLMVTTAIKMDWKIYGAVAIGLLSGLMGGFLLAEALEDREVLMYGLLSLLMLYLFFTSKNMGKHIKEHVDKIASNTTSIVVGLFTVWFIFARESMEVFTFMFQSINNTPEGWLGAAVATSLIVGAFPLIKKHVPTTTLFSITRYAFLVFALWFGYEALEHAHIL